MTCAEVRASGRDIARQAWLNETDKAEAAAHLRHCTQCAAWVEAERDLDTAFRDLAVEARAGAPSREVESAVMLAFAQRGRGRWLAWGLPAAAAAMVLIGLFWYRVATPPRQPAAVRQEAVSGFIPVRYGAPIRPYETLQVMRLDLPRLELARLGLPVGPENARGMVKADVLLGEDGLVKAIRFVYGSQEVNSKGVTE